MTVRAGTKFILQPQGTKDLKTAECRCGDTHDQDCDYAFRPSSGWAEKLGEAEIDDIVPLSDKGEVRHFQLIAIQEA